MSLWLPSSELQWNDLYSVWILEALDIKAEKKEQKKKQKGKRREAASKKLIAVGEKIKHLTITT